MNRYNYLGIMKAKQSDIKTLTAIGGCSRRHHTEIGRVVELLNARKIERLDIARNFTNSLSSLGKKKQATAKDRLRFYSAEYI